LINDRRVLFSGQHTFVGFDRERPIIAAIQAAMLSNGIKVSNVPDAVPTSEVVLQTCENTTSELRSAGAWARRQIANNPEARIAIIANGLDKDAEAPHPAGSMPTGRYLMQ